jgi:hypothetical protein
MGYRDPLQSAQLQGSSSLGWPTAPSDEVAPWAVHASWRSRRAACTRKEITARALADYRTGLKARPDRDSVLQLYLAARGRGRPVADEPLV